MWVSMTMVTDVRTREGHMQEQMESLPPQTHLPESIKIHGHIDLSAQPKKEEFELEPYRNAWNHMDPVLEGQKQQVQNTMDHMEWVHG